MKLRKGLMTTISLVTMLCFVPQMNVSAQTISVTPTNYTSTELGSVVSATDKGNGKTLITIDLSGVGTDDNVSISGDWGDNTDFSVALDGEKRVNVSQGSHFYAIESGTIHENYGHIHTVWDGAEVFVNKENGYIELANGTVQTNLGKIDKVNTNVNVNLNQGTIVYNRGNITLNEGIVEKNDVDYGKISTNNENGIVKHNGGEIGVNYGLVALNEGTITTNEASGRVYENTDGNVVNNEGGFVTNAPYVEGVNENSDTTEGAFASESFAVKTEYEEKTEKAYEELKDLARKLVNKEIAGKQTVYLNVGTALRSDFMKLLWETPELILDFTYYYEGKWYHVIIPGGKNVLYDERIPWYGPYWLKDHYGV